MLTVRTVLRPTTALSVGLTALAFSSATGCSTAASSVSYTANTQLNTSSIVDFFTAIPADKRSKVFADAGQMTFSELADVVKADATVGAFSINGSIYALTKSQLDAKIVSLQVLSASYKNLADYWQANGVDASALAPASVQSFVEQVQKRPVSAGGLGLLGASASKPCLSPIDPSDPSHQQYLRKYNATPEAIAAAASVVNRNPNNYCARYGLCDVPYQNGVAVKNAINLYAYAVQGETVLGTSNTSSSMKKEIPGSAGYIDSQYCYGASSTADDGVVVGVPYYDPSSAPTVPKSF